MKNLQKFAVFVGAGVTLHAVGRQSLETMQKSDGMNYAPVGKPSPVVAAGEFPFAAVALDHGHEAQRCLALLDGHRGVWKACRVDEVG